MKVTSFRFVLKNNIYFKLARRPYSRGSRSMTVKGGAVKVITPEQEREKLEKMGVNVTDPTANAHIKYLPDDPVQKNMKHSNVNISQNKRNNQESIYQKMASSKVSRGEINGIHYTKIQDEDISKKFRHVDFVQFYHLLSYVYLKCMPYIAYRVTTNTPVCFLNLSYYFNLKM